MAMLLEWDKPTEHFYETGLDRGVLYTMKNDGTYNDGVSWSGLTAVNENPSGADVSKLWADNTEYLALRASEEFGATIEAFYYPDEFAECNGYVEIGEGLRIAQQTRKNFGFTYRNKIGNDTQYDDYGYKIHIVWNCSVSPSSVSHTTINESPEAGTMSWELSTTKTNVAGYKPTAHMEIDSTKVDETFLTWIEEKLYGKAASTGTSPSAEVPATLPTPDEIIAKYEELNPSTSG